MKRFWASLRSKCSASCSIRSAGRSNPPASCSPETFRLERAPLARQRRRYAWTSAPPQLRHELRRRFVDLRELIAARKAKGEVDRAGVDPALEPLDAPFDRPGVRRLARHDGLRRRGVVRLEKARETLLGGGAVRVERQRDVRRARHRAEWSPGRTRSGLDAGKVLREELDAGPRRKPCVEARGDSERRGSATADPDRRAARTMGLGLHRDVVEREVFAGEAHVIAAPERLADLDRLEESPYPPIERHAGGGEFLADRRIVRGEAHAEDDAAFGGAIERADDVREHDGIAQGGQEHARTELHPSRAAGDRGHERERLVARARRQRVADPDGVEARALRAFGHGQKRRRFRAVRHDGLARGNQYAELESHRYLPDAYFSPSASSQRR